MVFFSTKWKTIENAYTNIKWKIGENKSNKIKFKAILLEVNANVKPHETVI